MEDPIHKFLQLAHDAICHLQPHLDRFRLYSNQANFGRFQIHPFCGKEEIGKADVVNGKFRLKSRENLIILNLSDIARFPAEIDRINEKDSIACLQKR